MKTRLSKEKVKISFLILIFLPAVFLWIVILNRKPLSNKVLFQKISTEVLSKPISLNSLFYDEKLFYKGVDDAKKNYKKMDFPIKGGIIPHHLLPGLIISDFFMHLTENPPLNIIIIGPNHPEIGKNILSAFNNWETPFGIVETNVDYVQRLTEQGLVALDEKTLSEEHSLGGLMPYIKYYLPSTKVIPIAVRATNSLDDVIKLANLLLPFLKEDNTVILASVDFSHYLSSEKAQENDKLTLEKIESNNYEALLNMDNDYLDSPIAIATFLKIMEENKLNHKVLFNSNSGILTGINSGVTSYFSIAYY